MSTIFYTTPVTPVKKIYTPGIFPNFKVVDTSSVMSPISPISATLTDSDGKTIYWTDTLAKNAINVVTNPPPLIKTDVPIITATNTIYPAVLTTKSYLPTTYSTDFNKPNYFAQKQMTEYLLYRILDKWLYDKKLCYILKYMKIEGGKVKLVKSSAEHDNVKLCDETDASVERKADFIQTNFLTKDKMKEIIMKVLFKTNLKWFDLSLPQYEKIIVKATGKYLRHKFRKALGMSD